MNRHLGSGKEPGFCGFGRSYSRSRGHLCNGPSHRDIGKFKEISQTRATWEMRMRRHRLEVGSRSVEEHLDIKCNEKQLQYIRYSSDFIWFTFCKDGVENGWRGPQEAGSPGGRLGGWPEENSWDHSWNVLEEESFRDLVKGQMWRVRRGESSFPQVGLGASACSFYHTSVPTYLGKPFDLKSESFKTLNSFCFALFYILSWEISNIYKRRENSTTNVHMSPPAPKIVNL